MLKSLYRRFNWLRDVVAPVEKAVAFDLSLGSLHVGTLTREGEFWSFAYSETFRKQHEIAPIVDFPKVDLVYRSKDLWPFFALRIPSITQAHVQEYLHEIGQDQADAAELMKRFGRRSIANPFVLEAA